MITMAMVAFLIFGVMAYMNLPLNLMPDIDFPMITIQTVYGGASPDQIENLITKKIEDEVSSIGQIDSITSYSLNSLSLILLKFDLDKDVDVANQEVKTKVDAIINDLPDDAQTPILSKVDLTATSVVNLVLSGNLDPAEMDILASGVIKDTFSRIEGVGNVNVTGNLAKEIKVNLSNRVVYENSLNLIQIAGILSQANLDMPGGNFLNEGEEYSVRLDGQIDNVEALGRIPVPTSSGFRNLDQLAEISTGTEEVRERVTFFNRTNGALYDQSILISVIKSGEGNPVSIAEEVLKAIPEIEKRLPPNVSLDIAKDESIFIQGTVDDTMSNIIMGILLTAGIILFFLHDFRSTLIVALSMPLSIIPTFIFMDAMGITLNLLSLMGLSVSVGVLVQNSVVVLENIFRHKRMGHDGKEAAGKGTGEVTLAVLASTLTNVCVFLPIGLMDGIAGLMMKDFAITVVIATIFSLIISFTLTPMLASLLLAKPEGEKKGLSLAIVNMFTTLEQAYTKVLGAILKSRLRSAALIAVTIGLFILAMAQFGKIPFEFSSAMDSGVVSVEVELPNDSSLEQTAEKVIEIEKIIVENRAVESVLSNLGSISSMDTGTNLALLSIELVNKEERDSNRHIAAMISSQLSVVSNVEIRVKATSSVLSSGASPVSLYLQGDDSDSLIANSQLFEDQMRSIEGLSAVSSSLTTGKSEVVLFPDRRLLSEMGMSVSDLALSMRAAVEGIVLTQLKSEGQEYDIRVSLKDSDVMDEESLSNIAIATNQGIFPLSHFAEVGFESSTGRLLRVDKISTIEFSADLLPGYVIGDVTGLIERAAAENLSDDISLKWAGDADMMMETVMNMLKAFIIAIVLTYMLLAAILEKFGQPLLILSTVPLSLIGVIALFLMTGFSMNIASMLAIIMLVGMVVNNAILILDYTNQLRKEGYSVHDALLEACPTKLQPILMANLATILGMLPMALGIGASGAEMRQPLGVVSIGGLLAATLLTLFVIPAIENAVEGKKEKKKIKVVANDAN